MSRYEMFFRSTNFSTLNKKSVLPTGGLRANMEYFRQFYVTPTGKFPENFGPISLRDADE
jgi:hypothetical protein